jgi:hypothetical protein
MRKHCHNRLPFWDGLAFALGTCQSTVLSVLMFQISQSLRYMSKSYQHEHSSYFVVIINCVYTALSVHCECFISGIFFFHWGRDCVFPCVDPPTSFKTILIPNGRSSHNWYYITHFRMRITSHLFTTVPLVILRALGALSLHSDYSSQRHVFTELL